MNINLADQMGAMTHVYKLRREDMKVAEYIDLPARKKIIEARLAEYYRTKSIDVDAQLIKQGVDEYFSQRLVFRSTEIKGIALLLARAFIVRHLWLKKAIVSMMVILLCVIAGVSAKSAYQSYNMEQTKETLASNQLLKKGLQNQISDLATQHADLKAQFDLAPISIANRGLADTERQLLEVQRLNTYQLTATVPTQGNYQELNVTAGNEHTKLRTFQKTIDNIRRDIGAITSVAKAHTNFMALLANPAYSELLKYKTIESDVDEINQILKNTNGSFNQLINHVDSLDARLSKATDVPTKLQQVEKLKKLFDEFAFKGDEKEVTDSLIKSAYDNGFNLDGTALANSIDDLQNLYAFANQKLDVNVVDRSGIRSGVERQFNDSKGKSWFVIVEATSPDGRVVPVKIKNIENGATKVVSQFGVRISKEDYDRLKTEKKSTGHIAERNMGVKPEKSISFKLEHTYGAKPEFITHW